MLNRKKKIGFLLAFLSFFMLCSREVYAKPFYGCGIGGFGYNQSYTAVFPGKYISTSMKCMKNSKGQETWAYCSSQHAPNVHGPYIRDKQWKKEKKCIYFFKKKRKKRNAKGEVVKNKKTGKTVYEYYYKKKKDGDCSVILGYIIKTANDKYTSGSYMSYAMALFSNWTYLKKYTPEKYHLRNSGPKGGWKSNSVIKDVFYTAWKKYKKDYVDSGEMGNASEDAEHKDMYLISGDVIFNYIPNGTCGSGSYKSNVITVSNNTNKTIVVSIHTAKNVKMCISGVGCFNEEEKSITLYPKGNTSGLDKKAIYFTSTGYVSDFTNILFSGDYTVKKNVSRKITYYDTERFNPGDNSSQPITYMEPVYGSINDKVEINYYWDTSKSVSFERITSKGCPVSSDYSNDKYYYGAHNFTGKYKKGCANDDIKDGSKFSTPTISGCTCTNLDLGSGRSVRVILKEDSKFTYGTFAPNYVYPGGGFALSNSTNGLPTTYISNVSWDFADYKNGVAQYFNGSSMQPATGMVGTINTSFINRFLKDKTLDLEIHTKDSNKSSSEDASNVNNYSYSISNALNFTKIEEKKFKATIPEVVLKKAYAAADGEIEYSMDEKHKIDSGNKYYVPLKYVDTLVSQNIKKDVNFPFNIRKTNLSSTKLFNFSYEADCSEPVIYDLINKSCTPEPCEPLPIKYNLSYRTVNVNEPFPTTVPINWSEFWNGPNNTQNRLRMSQTFNDVNNPLYKINITDEKFKDIISYNNTASNYYTTWKVDSNGSDSFVTSRFDSQATNSSYCEIGRYSEECDKK